MGMLKVLGSRIETSLFRAWRMWAYGGALLFAYLVVFVTLLMVGGWLWNAKGEPSFIDFIWIWTASQFAIAPNAADAYDFTTFAAQQAQLVEATRGDYPYFHWIYPPFLFLLIWPLGALDYAGAFVAWIVATGLLYLRVVHLIVPNRLAFLLAILPYAVAKNIYLGHTGFLVAGLLGLSLVWMKSRPCLAGACLGLLAFKPQFGLIFPIVLLLGREWRVFAAALGTVIVQAAVTLWLYGVPVWIAYLATLRQTNTVNFMTDGNLDATIQTIFGLMHWAGASIGVKWTMHLAGAAGSVLTIFLVWRTTTAHALRASALACGAVLATPYMLAYDLTTLSIPMAFLVRDGLDRGFLPGERLVMLGCFLAMFQMHAFPVGPILATALLALTLSRVVAFRDRPAP